MPCPKPHPQEGYLKDSLCMQYKLIAFYISGWFHFYGLNLHWTENLLVLRMVFPSYASRWFSQGTIKNRDATLYKQLSLYVQFTELTINSHSQKISAKQVADTRCSGEGSDKHILQQSDCDLPNPPPFFFFFFFYLFIYFKFLKRYSEAEPSG